MVMTASVLHWVETGDHRLMRRLNRWRPPRWFRLWMVAATRGGDGWLWYGFGLGIALDGGVNSFRTVAAAILAVAIGIALFLMLKKSCGRRRPCALEPHSWAQLLPPDQYSFPSGHTITAFAVAIPVCIFYPVLFAYVLFSATSVAVSRVLL